jgi:protein-S-isoprenylcysteine O-methyltransferase Ste14
MLSEILGVSIVLIFFATETRIRTGQAAGSWQAGASDQRSTQYISLGYLVSAVVMLCTPLFNRLAGFQLPASVGWLGLAVAVFGLLFRWWANRVLGAYYTRTLKVVENQAIVQAGPYRVIRHPGYLGSILMWCGVATSTTNALVLAIVLVIMLVIYSYRIHNEEAMLVASSPAYADYRKHTWRLVPFLY